MQQETYKGYFRTKFYLLMMILPLLRRRGVGRRLDVADVQAVVGVAAEGQRQVAGIIVLYNNYN